jgi:transglutaminase-like putative cysteine protease
MKLGTILICSAALAAGCSATRPGAERDGVRTGTFEVRSEYIVRIPDGAGIMRAWFVLPQQEPAQRVSDLHIECPEPYRLVRDSEGNSLLYVEVRKPAAGDFRVVETFRLERDEVRADADPAKVRGATAEERAATARWLEPHAHVPVDAEIRALADSIAGAEENPVREARLFYDWVLQHADYWVKDPERRKASGIGDTRYCLTTRTGNCTDFHSLWISLMRSRGIPARMVYGAFLKKELDGLPVDQSFHCWAEFFAPGIGWVPIDVAAADIFEGPIAIDEKNETLVRRATSEGYAGPDPERVNYYFGNLEERRVVFSGGRDLLLDPPQEGGPVNAMSKAYVEIDGRAVPDGEGWVRTLTYRQLN